MSQPLGRLPGRVVRRAARPLLRARSARRTAAASDALRATPSGMAAPVREDELHLRVAIASSHRIVDADRLAMLEVVTRRLGEDLGGAGLCVHVRDASDPDMLPRSRAAWEGAGFALDHRADATPMATSLASVLAAMPEPNFLLQFDDMLPAGISPSWLAAAVGLLDRYGDRLVVAPVWPVATEVDGAARTVRLTSHVRRGAVVDLPGAAGRRPIAVERVGEHEFLIFENFTYGFFFNSLVARTAEFRERLAWYTSRLGTSSVHEIENQAASKLRGPFWTHVAVSADVAILDVDYAHTTAAVRDEVPQNRVAFEAVRDGWTVRVEPKVSA